MLFCSQQFLLFFLAVFVVYWAMPWRKARVYLLLVASFYFYAKWNEWLAVLIVISSTMDYLIARRMDAGQRTGERKVLLTLSILFNLGILCYFKYANFFLRSLEDGLRAGGASASFPVLSVILPIGISFYTFEAISYTVDVYRRKIRAEKNLGHFMLFILFFPHLVAGPIVRASDFLPQIRRPKRRSWLRFSIGGRLVVLGLFKKMVIADRMALLVDPVFANPTAFGTNILWLAAIAYAFQVYCDFSGYSDLALGTAHMLGYRLAVNFNMPFAAPNVTEFWRRWHISLSNWIRDYIFYPLGGSRRGEWRVACNLLVAMTLCGLWHGAAWPFVVWGVINGLYMIIHRRFRAWASSRPSIDALLCTRPGTWLRIALTFASFVAALVVFRNGSLTAGATMIGRMFRLHEGLASPVAPTIILLAVGTVALAHFLGSNANNWHRWERVPGPLRGLSYAGLLILTLLLAPITTPSFIYFQF